MDNKHYTNSKSMNNQNEFPAQKCTYAWAPPEFLEGGGGGSGGRPGYGKGGPFDSRIRLRGRGVLSAFGQFNQLGGGGGRHSVPKGEGGGRGPPGDAHAMCCIPH